VLSYLNKQDFATFDDEFETMIRKARQLAIKAGMKCSDIKKAAMPMNYHFSGNALDVLKYILTICQSTEN